MSYTLDLVGEVLYVKSGLTYSNKSYWRMMAREAIQVIRNPTDEVIEAGNRDGDGFNRAGIDPAKTVEIYQAMIDRILR